MFLHVHLGWVVAAYDLGEALANLVQPFWMLPILGLFGLKARDIMGYTFVVFLARVVGSIVDRTVFRTERGVGPGFYITVIVCEILFGLIASIIVAWFSRQREFRADRGSANLVGSPGPMVNALRRLGGVGEAAALPEGIKTLGITDKAGFMQLFSTHPPIEERIAALQSAR